MAGGAETERRRARAKREWIRQESSRAGEKARQEARPERKDEVGGGSASKKQGRRGRKAGAAGQ